MASVIFDRPTFWAESARSQNWFEAHRSNVEKEEPVSSPVRSDFDDEAGRLSGFSAQSVALASALVVAGTMIWIVIA